MNKPPFKVGDKVTTNHPGEDQTIVRTITKIKKSDICGSGWIASADGGKQCPTCGRWDASPLTDYDAPWFQLVKEEK